MTRGGLAFLVFLAVLLLASTTAASASSKHAVRVYTTHSTLPLRTAIMDPHAFVGAQQTASFAATRAAGATYVRLLTSWRSIAPATPPAGFDPTDPASPGYNWSQLDLTVRGAVAAGLMPILDVVQAPRWALVKIPKGFNAGTPKAAALGAFARAIATHYDGAHGVPAVRVFQVWNEANNTLFLSPVSGAKYRGMVNAFAAGAHAVNPANLVVAGALDPFKNKALRFESQAPLAFMRSFLCLSKPNPHAKKKKNRKAHATCKQRAQFDVWSHHPYTFKGPRGHANLTDDVSLGDLPEMRALLKTAVKLHRVVSAHPPQFWVTEFSWDTNPPRKHAAPVKLEARWTAEALYQMWGSGVSLATWFLLQDWPSPSPYQSGLFFHASSLTTAKAKPMRTSFRFPFVAYLAKGKVTVWGRDATSTRTLVTIQRRHGARGKWRTVAKIRANRWGIFQANLKLKATTKDSLRAQAAGSGTSLVFALKVPKDENRRYGPWGN